MSRHALPFLLLLVASFGCAGKPAPDTKPTPEPTTPAPPTAKPTDPNAPTADRTFAYWDGVARVQEVTARRYAALAEPKPDEVTKLLTDAANQVDDLSAEKTDPDAITVGKGFAESLRQLAGTKADPAVLSDAAGKARTTRAALSSRYGREFPALDWATAKDPAFRLARDLARPTARQELARLKGEVAKLDAEIKPLAKELDDEITEKDKLQGEADTVRNILKEQTSDTELKELRQGVLADATKQVEAKKKVIDELTKKVTALRVRRGDLDRLANEVSAILTEGDPEKAEKLPTDRLLRLRVLADKVTEKLDAQKEKAGGK